MQTLDGSRSALSRIIRIDAVALGLMVASLAISLTLHARLLPSTAAMCACVMLGRSMSMLTGRKSVKKPKVYQIVCAAFAVSCLFVAVQSLVASLHTLKPFAVDKSDVAMMILLVGGIVCLILEGKIGNVKAID